MSNKKNARWTRAGLKTRHAQRVWRGLAGLLVVGAAIPAFAEEVFTPPTTWSDERVDDTTYTFNIQSCQDLLDPTAGDVRLEWELLNPIESAHYAIGRGSCTGLNLDGEDCTPLVPNALVPTATVDGNVVVTWTGSANELLGLNSDRCGDDTDSSLTLSVFYDQVSLASSEVVEFPVTINLQQSRPTAPELLDLVAGEAQVNLTWDSVSGISRYAVYHSENADDFEVLPEDWPGSNASIALGTEHTIQDLAVDTTYYIAVVSEDSYGNQSRFPSPSTVMTVPATDFWEAYRAEGGVEEGGCSSVPRSQPWVWGLVGVALLVSRRRM